ncbi:hypothetical protein VB264_06365 [Arcicella aquatica]|uniref:Uncharacterized protein n=1 Tax=Arcicella aquatica TaxID=217141 RepID=A0ABU5QKM7_9BACT|nr:hypothetical protein [Arcicella aquatica]MEA5257399.1 hypothetical protein [Arcicella aquatica]
MSNLFVFNTREIDSREVKSKISADSVWVETDPQLVKTDPKLGGVTKDAEELIKMMKDFSGEIISHAFEFSAYSFDKDSIKRLTEQSGYEGLAISFVKFDGRISVALTALDSNNNPLIVQQLKKDEQGINTNIVQDVLGEEDGTGHPRPGGKTILEFLEAL